MAFNITRGQNLNSYSPSETFARAWGQFILQSEPIDIRYAEPQASVLFPNNIIYEAGIIPYDVVSQPLQEGKGQTTTTTQDSGSCPWGVIDVQYSLSNARIFLSRAGFFDDETTVKYNNPNGFNINHTTNRLNHTSKAMMLTQDIIWLVGLGEYGSQGIFNNDKIETVQADKPFLEMTPLEITDYFATVETIMMNNSKQLNSFNKVILPIDAFNSLKRPYNTTSGMTTIEFLQKAFECEIMTSYYANGIKNENGDYSDGSGGYIDTISNGLFYDDRYPKDFSLISGAIMLPYKPNYKDCDHIDYVFRSVNAEPLINRPVSILRGSGV